ncbi:uncharacterized protein DS421_13g439670 [Arachis hypogaea]|nr:uncharacterized protein DS421_13g439670 [Arachis hypogaea]
MPLVEEIPTEVSGGLAGTAKRPWIAAHQQRRKEHPTSLWRNLPASTPRNAARNPSLDFGSALNTSGSRAAYHLLRPALPCWLSTHAAANRGSITGDEVEHLIGSA